MRPSRAVLVGVAGLLFLLGVLPMANIVTTGGGLQWWPAAVAQWLTFGTVAAAVALALGAALPDATERLASRSTSALLAPSPAGFAVATGVLTAVMSLGAGYLMFHLCAASGDEFAQLWEASLLRHGMLSARAEPFPEFFNTAETLVVNGRWFSQFPIGGPALLSIGWLVGVPWLVNPLLAGIGASAVYFAAREPTDEITARGASLLVAASPFVVFMAGSQMNHVGTLAALWVALAAAARWCAPGRGSHWWAALIGLAFGIAATIRPYDAVLFALPVGVLQLWHLRAAPARWRTLVTQAAAGLVPVAALLIVNARTTGAPLSFAYDVLNGAGHRPGFHLTPAGFVHTPLRGLYMASAYLMKLDVALLGWPVPGILLVAMGMLLVRAPRRFDVLFASIVALVMAGYAAYWAESYYLGPRFLYALSPIFLLYVARLPALLRERIRMPRLRSGVLLLVPCWLLVAAFAPVRPSQLFGVRELAMLSTVHQTGTVMESAVRGAGLTNALVFIPESLHGRLTARVRALGMQPLAAEYFVAHHDACTIMDAFDAADRMPAGAVAERLALVTGTVTLSAPINPIPELPPDDQIALEQTRAVSPACGARLSTIRAFGSSLAALLPLSTYDSTGTLGGNVVYARDLGERDELLRGRFGNRRWFRVRLAGTDGAVTATVEPYHNP